MSSVVPAELGRTHPVYRRKADPPLLALIGTGMPGSSDDLSAATVTGDRADKKRYRAVKTIEHCGDYGGISCGQKHVRKVIEKSRGSCMSCFPEGGCAESQNGPVPSQGRAKRVPHFAWHCEVQRDHSSLGGNEAGLSESWFASGISLRHHDADHARSAGSLNQGLDRVESDEPINIREAFAPHAPLMIEIDATLGCVHVFEMNPDDLPTLGAAAIADNSALAAHRRTMLFRADPIWTVPSRSVGHLANRKSSLPFAHFGVSRW